MKNKQTCGEPQLITLVFILIESFYSKCNTQIPHENVNMQIRQRFTACVCARTCGQTLALSHEAMLWFRL